MKKTGLLGFWGSIFILIVFGGCATIIGGGIGVVAEKTSSDYTQLPASKIIHLEFNSQIKIHKKDGSTLDGRYRGICGYDSSREYSDFIIPKFNESIEVVDISNISKRYIFESYYYSDLSTPDGSPVLSLKSENGISDIRCDSLKVLIFASGDSIDMATLNRSIISDRSLSNIAILVFSDKGMTVYPLGDISGIKAGKDRDWILIGLASGAAIDLVLYTTGLLFWGISMRGSSD